MNRRGLRKRTAPIAVVVSVCAIVLLVSGFVGLVAKFGRDSGTASAGVDELTCDGSMVIDSYFTIGEDMVPGLPDSSTDALVQGATKKAEQAPKGQIQKKDARPENFSKSRKDPNNLLADGQGLYAMTVNNRMVGELHVMETLFEGKKKFWVDMMSACAP
jgi:hypothetical protein